MKSDAMRLEKDIETLLSGYFLSIITLEDQLTLTRLRSQKKKLQEHLLLTWKLKSQTNWVLYGDSNTKFFHAISSGRRNHNTIWSLEDEEGHCIQDEHALKEMGKRYFAQIFSDDKQTCLLTQLQVVSLYPSMVSQVIAPNLIAPVTLSEIESALKSFKKDRSPGLDGWPVEFYLHFFELLGNELLHAIECARTSGYITPSLNSTFIALIPKKDKPPTFANFRPISLCNLLYKLIAKLIAVRLKPFLDSHIPR